MPVDRDSALGPIVEAMGGRSVQPSKTVLVTGSTGVLGRSLLARIGGWAGHEFIALDRDRAEALHGDTVARCVDWRAATVGALDFGLGESKPVAGPIYHDSPIRLSAALTVRSSIYRPADFIARSVAAIDST